MLRKPEFGGTMHDEGIKLDERTRVQQQVEPFPGGQLALAVLAVDAGRSPAEQGFGAHLVEAAHALIVRRHRRSNLPTVLVQRRRPMIVVRQPLSTVSCSLHGCDVPLL